MRKLLIAWDDRLVSVVGTDIFLIVLMAAGFGAVAGVLCAAGGGCGG